MTTLSVVGKSITRIDALEKVTGKAKYTIDEGIGLPGMLYGKILWSPYPHAKILHIDTSRASRLSGVKAVLTGEESPLVRMGDLVDDQYILARGKVRFVGDAVAAIAASTVEAAEEALDLIRVEYEELPVIFDAEEAMKPDCPVVLHPDLASYNRPLYAYLGWDLPGPNVHTHHKIRKGNMNDGFRKADLIIENRFSTARISHCQLESANSLAYMEGDGTLVVLSSAKQLYSIRAAIAKVFDLPLTKVRVMTSYTGGNFGTVARTSLFAALLVLKTGKPVKIVFSREETFLRDLARLPMVIYLKDGIKHDGTLLAREMRMICNSGAYADLTPLIIRNGSFGVSQYRVPNFKWDAYGVYTNEPPCGAFRGFGNSQPLWAIEQQMDIIAEKLGMDAVELRKKNIIGEGEENVHGEITHSIGAEECLEKAAEWIRIRESPEKMSGSLMKGKGLALGNKYTMVETVSSATIKVRKDGTIELHHGSDEIGQGANTILAQIVAEEFNVPMEKVKVVWGDTAKVPYDFGAISSRTTLFTGNAVRLACQDAKRQLFEAAARKLEAEPAELESRDGKIYLRESPEKTPTIDELFGTKANEAQKWTWYLDEGEEVVGKGTFLFKDASTADPETGQGKRLTASYSYVAQVVEVAVDVDTGAVKVLRFCSANDMGRSINPKLCEGQIEGGAAMGIGSTLYEEVVLDKGGQLNPDFHDYRMPCAMQIPSGQNMNSIIVEAPHRDGPFGAKGMSEGAMTPSAPAIANAIYNAIGVRILDLPITPEKVLKSIQKSGCKIVQEGENSALCHSTKSLKGNAQIV